ncbi:MAG: hypothetical protein Q9202_007368 [Teloschistes flavicans]
MDFNSFSSHRSHTRKAFDTFKFLASLEKVGENEITVDGNSLDVAAVIAVARFGATINLAAETSQKIEKSATYLQDGLTNSDVIYGKSGVNTGFGASADTRTQKMEELQAVLIRELHVGVLSKPNESGDATKDAAGSLNDSSNNAVPESWARASMVLRVNSLASGHSGVRPILIGNLVELLKHNIIPRIPLRGSISASGDLVPLSYLGGVLEGKHSVSVWAGSKSDRRIMSAAQALSQSALVPIQMGPKEGLAIVNGTAVSTGVGVLAIHDANSLAILSQVLTAMSVEALQGTTESFDPFLDAVRPHPGQKEAARNIRGFLSGSKLSMNNDGLESGTLRQDRYSIRTASQWLGPLLEDLDLATQQISIECNSVTDNPLIDIDSEHPGRARIVHGGNFQAKAITSAMEKTRLALQSMGQMLFAQCTELINPQTNRGLPPNLVVDEPSESFLFKMVDIQIAALQSELGFLSNPAGTHVQWAETGNQSLNSLGLISARYTHTAVEVLTQLAACHLMTLCQALDLRAMNSRFLETFQHRFRDLVSSTIGPVMMAAPVSDEPLNLTPSIKSSSHPSMGGVTPSDSCNGDAPTTESEPTPATSIICELSSVGQASSLDIDPAGSNDTPTTQITKQDEKSDTTPLEALQTTLWKTFTKELNRTTTMDSDARFAAIFQSLLPAIIASVPPPQIPDAIKNWTQTTPAAADSARFFRQNREMYHASPDATSFLGNASRHMYEYVRKDLGIPFLRTAMLRHAHQEEEEERPPAYTTGDLITKIAEAIRSGKLYAPVMESVAQLDLA